MSPFRRTAVLAVLLAVVLVMPAAADAAAKRRRPVAPAGWPSRPYASFAPQPGAGPWWTRPSSLRGAPWVYPYFPRACFQADRAAGGASASAWQVLWVHRDTKPSRLASQLRSVRLSVRAAQSIFAASADRYVRNQQDLFARSLAPRFVTNSECRVDVRDVRVPAGVYDAGYAEPGGSSPVPIGPGTIADWLAGHGYAVPNRKYLVLLQAPPAYPHGWAGVSEDLAAGTGASPPDERPTLDNAANYTSYSFVDIWWILTGDLDMSEISDAAALIAHEMTHALGAMTPSAPHDNPANPLHPSDCWDVLCYGARQDGQTYTHGCGSRADGAGLSESMWQFRLDCNRDDYWAPATDTGLPAATWTTQRWAVSSSSFLYGNPQPTAAQLAAHGRRAP